MRGGEAGDDGGDGAETATDHQQAEQKQQVIGAAQDVLDAEAEVTAEAGQRRRPGRLRLGGDWNLEHGVVGAQDLLA